MTLRRILLGATALVGAFIGLWAAAWPESFYDSFPGLGRVWIAVDGPFNEHLIRVVGVAWTVFGIPHLIYHAAQFGGMPVIEVIGNIIGLGGSLLLGIVLMLPGPRIERCAETTIDEKESIG